MNCFEGNKKACLNFQNNLEWLFTKSPEQTSVVTEVSRTGSPVCRIDGKWMCSRYSPEEEARKFVLAQSVKPGDFIVLYGFGMGYHLKPILEAIGGEGFLYCIETNSLLLRAALEARDFSGILGDRRFKLIISGSPEELAKQMEHHLFWNLETVPAESMRVIIHEPSFAVIPEEFGWIRNILEIIKFDRRGDSVFYDEMKANLMANLQVVLTSPGIRCLKKTLAEAPVIFIGSGPSLDKGVEVIKKLSANAFIVCVDSALIPVHEYGLTPDLIISIDPQKKSSGHFIMHSNSDIPVIVFPTSASRIVNNVKGRKIIAVQHEGWVSRHFDHRLDFLGITYGGSAVSVIGADIILNSCRGPVLFAGMDYSFPNFKAYANYAPEFNKWHQLTGPYYTLETASVDNIYSRKTVFLENFMGKQVPTFQSMYSYLRSLEAVIEFHKRQDIYVLSPEGARIQGVNPLYFEDEIIKLFPCPVSKKIDLSPDPYDQGLYDFCMKKISEL